MTEMDDNRFARALDAIVTGDETLDPEPLATFALAMQVAEGFPHADPLDADRRAAIWRQLVTGHAYHPTTGGPGPLAQPAMALPANPWARRPGSGPRRNGIVPYTGRFQTALTAFAVVAILLAAWSGFSSFRETGSPSITPTAFAHGVASATPEASPAVVDWTAPVQPEECDVAPMPFEDYAEIMRQQPDISGRSYGVVGPTDPQTADAVVKAARAHAACVEFGTTEQERSQETAPYIFFRTASAARTTSAEVRMERDLKHARVLSAQFPLIAPEQLQMLTDVVPEHIREQIEEWPPIPYARFWFGYNPALAMTLDDGRVAVPLVYMVWNEDPKAPTSEEIASTPMPTQMFIFANDSGTWKIDEFLYFCSGECDAYWARMEAPASPAASPVATPAATPRD